VNKVCRSILLSLIHDSSWKIEKISTENPLFLALSGLSFSGMLVSAGICQPGPTVSADRLSAGRIGSPASVCQLRPTVPTGRMSVSASWDQLSPLAECQGLPAGTNFPHWKNSSVCQLGPTVSTGRIPVSASWDQLSPLADSQNLPASTNCPYCNRLP
jgi:hypothetical protein